MANSMENRNAFIITTNEVGTNVCRGKSRLSIVSGRIEKRRALGMEIPDRFVYTRDVSSKLTTLIVRGLIKKTKKKPFSNLSISPIGIRRTHYRVTDADIIFVSLISIAIGSDFLAERLLLIRQF